MKIWQITTEIKRLQREPAAHLQVGAVQCILALAKARRLKTKQHSTIRLVSLFWTLTHLYHGLVDIRQIDHANVSSR